MRTPTLNLVAAVSLATLAMGGMIEPLAAQTANTQSANTQSAAAQNVSDLVPEIEWNTTLKKYQFDADKFLGQRFSAKCPPRTIRDKDDPVYGTDVYPSNNPICVAAAHAGKIAPEDGGLVTVQLNPGAESYAGSSRNGIATADLPGTPRSMVFVDFADSAAADEVQRPYLPRLKWDTKFTATGFANKNLIGQRFSFDCPSAPNNMRSRRVSGTDSYAFHSIVCRAAVHAGKITTDGGLVTLQIDPGMQKLVGSIRNGIETKDGPGGHRTISFVDGPVVN